MLDNSLLLLIGTAAALFCSNVDVACYDTITDPLRFWVNDVGMAFFFTFAAKGPTQRSAYRYVESLRTPVGHARSDSSPSGLVCECRGAVWNG